MNIQLKFLIDDRKCYEMVREMRCPKGIECSKGGSHEGKKRGFHPRQAYLKSTLRAGIVAKKPIKLSGKVESNEVYITARHKEHPAIAAHEKRKGRRRKLRGSHGRGTLAGKRPPVLGMIQCDGEVFIHMLPNVQQATIQPIIPTVSSVLTLYQRA